MAEVVLWHGAQRIRLIALVDSGADASLMDYAYAELLGLDPADADKTESVGASGSAFEEYSWPNAGLELQFEGSRFPFLGSFVKSEGDSEIMNLLGRSDFFSQYMIQFWEVWGVMQIDTSPDVARPAPA